MLHKDFFYNFLRILLAVLTASLFAGLVNLLVYFLVSKLGLP